MTRNPNWSRRRFNTSSLLAALTGSSAILMNNRITFAAGTPPGTVTAMAIAPQQQLLCVGSHSQVSLLSTETLTVTRTISTDMPNVHDVAISPGQNSLIVAGGYPGENGSIESFDLTTGRPIANRSVGDDCLYTIRQLGSANGWLASSSDGECYWSGDLDDAPVSSFASHSRAVLAATPLAGGETCVSVGRDQTVRVWDRETADQVHSLHYHTGDVTTVAVRPATSGLPMIATTSIDRSVRFWQPTIGRMVRFARLNSPVLSGCWNATGTQFIVGCRDGLVATINPDTVAATPIGQIDTGWVNAVAVNENRVFAASHMNKIHQFTASAPSPPNDVSQL